MNLQGVHNKCSSCVVSLARDPPLLVTHLLKALIARKFSSLTDMFRTGVLGYSRLRRNKVSKIDLHHHRLVEFMVGFPTGFNKEENGIAE